MSHLNISGVDKPLDHIRLNNVRSENLWDEDYTGISGDLKYVPVFVGDGMFTLSTDAPTYSGNAPLFLLSGNVTSGASTPTNGVYNGVSRTKGSLNGYITIAFRRQSESSDPATHKTMLNTGSTALPYQPYLITKEAWEAKSRVILHGLTNPLCGIGTYKDTLDLSTGTLTRYVKKLVLTGQEAWNWYSDGTVHQFYTRSKSIGGVAISSAYSTIAPYGMTANNRNGNYGCYTVTGGDEIAFQMYGSKSDFPTLTEWESYLAAQYSAGHPVTVWYVLATPETEQITVPSNLTGIVEGYLTQSSTPTPTNPIYPTANGTLEQGGTYSLDTGAYAIAWGRADTFTGTNSISARCYGLPVKSWEVDGNSQQTGTPSPDNIIMPEFVGERTGNLCGINGFASGETEQKLLQTVVLNAGTYTYSCMQNGTLVSNSRNCLMIRIGQAPYTYESTQNNYHLWAGKHTLTFTVTNNNTSVELRYWINNFSNVCSFDSFMLNLGSTSLPYEPYGYAIQTYSSTQSTVSGQTPLTLTDSVGHNLISWDGEGATTSSGTPSPTSPVTVSGWGDKTGNLFDTGTVTLGKYINAQNVETDSTAETPVQALNHTDYIAIQPNTDYTYHYKFRYGVANTIALCWFDASKNLISRNTKNIYAQDKDYTLTGTSPANAAFCIINFAGYLPNESMELSFNSGSTALQYEPYGYKLTITSAGQTIPIYLGEVPTLRRVKKLVLDGTENWALWSSGQPDVERYYYKWGKTTPSGYDLICTHFRFTRSDGNFEHIRLGGNNRDDFVIFISKAIASTVEDFKAYLATQYANGTPVTAWYTLAEPTTGIVNEPLMKIGDYADSITLTQAGVTIPTAKGNATLTTSNTVQPSTMHATYDKYISGGDVPVYLGQVSTTRRIRKLVLTGNESWDLILSQTTNAYFYIRIGDYMSTIADTVISTHFVYANISTSTTGIGCDIINSSGGEDRLAIRPPNAANMSISDFTAWLAAQYAAGTPVIVWYVLAEPETAIVNEPLCKIDNYVDSLTSDQAGVTIPTTNGNNTISVDTSLAPSKFEVKVHAKPIS